MARLCWDLTLVISLVTRRGARHNFLEGDASGFVGGTGSAASSSTEEMLAVRRAEWSPLQTEAWMGVSTEPTP